MAAPDKTTLLTLDFYQNGQPFCNVLAPSGTTGTLDYYQNAQPFVEYAGGSPPPPVTNTSNFFFMFG
jgi:hypothetical protein